MPLFCLFKISETTETDMKKSILEGVLNTIFAAIDASAAWALWSLVSTHPITWPEWWIICFTGIGVVRSATRAWHGQNDQGMP